MVVISFLLAFDAAGGEAGNDASLEDKNEDDERAVTMTEAAMIVPRGISNCEPPERSAMATGTVRCSFDEVKVSAKRNSFHAAMKARSPVVTSAGHISGMKTG